MSTPRLPVLNGSELDAAEATALSPGGGRSCGPPPRARPWPPCRAAAPASRSSSASTSRSCPGRSWRGCWPAPSGATRIGSGRTTTVRADGPLARGRVRLRARPLALHRLPALRLRLRRGEQPVARPADPLDPRARDGEGEGRRLRARRPVLRRRRRCREPGHFYMPVQCQQCRNPPCTKVCPAGATWKEPDGIVVIDYDWCIGCRCCMAACPYGARHFNWAEPDAPGGGAQPQHALPRQPAAAQGRGREVHLLHPAHARSGRYPACVEVCPVGARKFGNLLDPESEIRYIIENKRVLRPQGGARTRMPKFFYFYAT